MNEDFSDWDIQQSLIGDGYDCVANELCRDGDHMYRLIHLGPDGTDEGALYRCEDCGSTDPEGDGIAASATVTRQSGEVLKREVSESV